MPGGAGGRAEPMLAGGRNQCRRAGGRISERVKFSRLNLTAGLVPGFGTMCSISITNNIQMETYWLSQVSHKTETYS